MPKGTAVPTKDSPPKSLPMNGSTSRTGSKSPLRACPPLLLESPASKENAITAPHLKPAFRLKNCANVFTTSLLRSNTLRFERCVSAFCWGVDWIATRCHSVWQGHGVACPPRRFKGRIVRAHDLRAAAECLIPPAHVALSCFNRIGIGARAYQVGAEIRLQSWLQSTTAFFITYPIQLISLSAVTALP